MWRAAAWNTWKTPSRLVANIFRHSSSVRSMKARLPPPPMPALAKQPSTRPRFQRGCHRRLDRSGIADVANLGSILPVAPHGCRGGLVLVGVAAPDRDVAALGAQRLRDAEPDTAIAAGDDGDAAGEVENAHGSFFLGVSIWIGALKSCVQMAGRCSGPTMDKALGKIKYGSRYQIRCTAERNSAEHKS